jgi:hypothetical protein
LTNGQVSLFFQNIKERLNLNFSPNTSTIHGISRVLEASEYLRVKRAPRIITFRIAIIFIILGALSIICAVYFSNQVLAFAGLGLTFWGVLFLLITPVRRVEGDLLPSTAVASYQTLDRIIKQTYANKAYYIAFYSADSPAPEYLKGLKEATVLITAETGEITPPIEDINKGSFVSKKPVGFIVTPPGLGLLQKIEKESKTDFAEVGMEELCEILPHHLTDNLLAKRIAMRNEKDTVFLELFGSLYEWLYGEEHNLQSAELLGCPIVSAVACAVAKTTGRTVAIKELRTQKDVSTTYVTFKVVQG